MSRTLTLRSCIMALAGFLWLLPLQACSGKQESGETTQRESSPSSESGESAEPTHAEHGEQGEHGERGEQAVDSAHEPGAVAQSEEPPVPAETSPPSPTAKSETPVPPSGPSPPPSAQAAAPPQTPPDAAGPASSSAGERVAVAATKPGITRVGVQKCKLCHRVEYQSWAAGAHAVIKPPLDCESCHGPGSEYAVISIMRDPEKARAAGLVIPKKSFCTQSCHAEKWQDDMLQHAHAHKVKAGGG